MGLIHHLKKFFKEKTEEAHLLEKMTKTPEWELKMDDYLERVRRMKRAFVDGKPSVAEPCLLLSVMYSVLFNGKENHFTVDDLEGIYTMLFERFGGGQPLTPIATPFYHMAQDGFWNLKWRNDAYAGLPPSREALEKLVEYGYLHETFYMLLQEPATFFTFNKLIVGEMLGGHVGFGKTELAMYQKMSEAMGLHIDDDEAEAPAQPAS